MICYSKTHATSLLVIERGMRHSSTFVPKNSKIHSIIMKRWGKRLISFSVCGRLFNLSPMKIIVPLPYIEHFLYKVSAPFKRRKKIERENELKFRLQKRKTKKFTILNFWQERHQHWTEAHHKWQ
jgi:hypothetical protein